MEIVTHEESTPIEIIPQFGRFIVAQIPVPDLYGVQPWPIVNIVSVFRCHRLFHGTGLTASQAPDGCGKMARRPGIINGPIAAPPWVPVHESSKNPFSGNIGIRRDWE